MAIYYVDPAAGGANNGSSWGDAWTSLQSYYDNGGAGDTCYARGTQTLAAPIDLDTNEGAITGPMRLVGCAADGSVDGTYFTLDGNAATAQCLKGAAGMDIYWLENIRCTNATGDGLWANGGLDRSVFVNCMFDSNGQHGVNPDSAMVSCLFVKCIFEGNTGDGIYPPEQGTALFFCFSYANGGSGYKTTSTDQSVSYIGCVSHGNTDVGFDDVYLYAVLFNCVADDEDMGIYVAGDYSFFIGNRITNCDTTGFDAGDEYCVAGWNYFAGNTANVANAGSCFNLPDEELLANWALGDGIDGSNSTGTADGYTNDAGHDFTLTTAASARRTQIDMNVGS